MKHAVPIALVLILIGVADSAAQRDDRISLFADDRMTACGLSTASPGFRSVYMFHLASEPATASRFSAPKPTCWFNATWVADVITPSFLSIGNSQTDLSVAYMGYTTGCSPSPILLGRIDYYFTGGLSPECCDYYAQPAAGTASILAVDCYYVEYEASRGSNVFVNPSSDCPCTLGPPSPDPEEPPRIEMFADEMRSTCALIDNSNAIRSVYLFHTGSDDATATQFTARIPDCWTGATWLADRISAPFLSIGNTQTDLSVAYTRCEDPPIFIGRIDYYSTGAASSCCVLEITAAPQTGGALIVDCDFEQHMVEIGEEVVVNPTAVCPCGDHLPDPVRVEKTTWGKVKAMYR